MPVLRPRDVPALTELSPRRVKGALVRLMVWPALTFAAAAALPVRFAREAPEAGRAVRIGAWLIAPFFALGVLIALFAFWLRPAGAVIDQVSGRIPGEPVGAGWVFVHLAAFLITPGWAWALGQLVERLREGTEPRCPSLALGALVAMFSVLGGAWSLGWTMAR